LQQILAHNPTAAISLVHHGARRTDEVHRASAEEGEGSTRDASRPDMNQKGKQALQGRRAKALCVLAPRSSAPLIFFGEAMNIRSATVDDAQDLLEYLAAFLASGSIPIWDFPKMVEERTPSN
jgi:hypothetical protein